ncbi:hypothetical protein [Oceaniglobus indicus]|uniref:hypothetical protein n=1 Tax=Oceaniglobus indicus TaxID=2047749 RepID=UPI000C18C97D|nr:hypothetical protein [Oceaniglobus indicus]
MSADLPDYYFRIRDNGAFVFRVEQDPRQRRIETNQIAVVNIRNNEVKPHGSHALTPEDLAAIEDWMIRRRETLARREVDDIHRAVDFLNTTTHWLQSRATDDQIDAVTDDLLLAMHDLRSVLVRKKAERAMRDVAD